MNWYDYDMGYAAAREEAEVRKAAFPKTPARSTGTGEGGVSLLVTFLFLLVFFVLVNLAAIATAYYLLSKYSFLTDQSWWVKMIVVLTLAYVIACAAAFMKGYYIRLRSKGNLFWILLFLATIAFLCGLPVYIVHELLEGLLSPVASWAIAVLAGVVIFIFQKPLNPGSHKYTFWVYAAGKNL